MWFNTIRQRITLLPFALREKGLRDEGHTPYQILKEHNTARLKIPAILDKSSRA
jgi:hypothetical protein